MTSNLLDLDLLDDDDPFEITSQIAHLYKHGPLGVDDVLDVWRSDPLFYPAKPPAHWLMVARVSGTVLVVPLTPRSVRQPGQVQAHRLLCRLNPPGSPLPGGPMNHPEMTPEQEHEFYSKPENQEPQGPARRRRQPMTDPVPVRFPPEMLERVRAAADADDRSVSSWIRRAVDRTLQAEAS